MPALPVIAQTIEDALTPIHDGIMLAVPREVAGVPMEATRALIRRGVRNLHLVTLPTSSLQADLLIGAGSVAVLETSAVSLDEFGPAPRFAAAVKIGRHPHQGCHLSGPVCRIAGCREGRSVH